MYMKWEKEYAKKAALKPCFMWGRRGTEEKETVPLFKRHSPIGTDYAVRRQIILILMRGSWKKGLRSISWFATIRRTVPDLLRMTSVWVKAWF